MYCGICGDYCGFNEQTKCDNKKCNIVKKYIFKHGIDKIADMLQHFTNNSKLNSNLHN